MSESSLEGLSYPLLEKVLSYLDWRSLRAVSAVSKHLRPAAFSANLWMPFLFRHFPRLSQAFNGVVADVAQLFASRVVAERQMKLALADLAAWMLHSEAPYPPETWLAPNLPSEASLIVVYEDALLQLSLASGSLTERKYADAALSQLRRQSYSARLEEWRAMADRSPLTGVLLVHRYHYPLLGPTDQEVNDFLAQGEAEIRDTLPGDHRYRVAGFAETPTEEESWDLIEEIFSLLRMRGWTWSQDEMGTRLDRLLETGKASEAVMATFIIEFLRRFGLRPRGLYYSSVAEMNGPRLATGRCSGTRSLRMAMPNELQLPPIRGRNLDYGPERWVPAVTPLFETDLPGLFAAEVALYCAPANVCDWQRRPVWEEGHVADAILAAHLSGPAVDEEANAENGEDRRWQAWTELLRRRTRLGLACDAVAANSIFGAGTISPEAVPFASYKDALTVAKKAAAKEVAAVAKRRAKQPRPRLPSQSFGLGQLVRLAGKAAIVRGWDESRPPKYLLLVDDCRGEKTARDILKDPQYTRGPVAESELEPGDVDEDAEWMLLHRRLHRFFQGFDEATGTFSPIPELARLYPDG